MSPGRRLVHAALLPVAAALAFVATPARGGGIGAPAGEIREGFAWRIEALSWGTWADLEPDGLNAGNLLGLPRWEGTLALRPDLELELRRLALQAKPRFELSRRRFELGPLAGTSETLDTLFVNEWRVEVRPAERLVLSGGRENVQWGPSYLLSPSNPLNRSNGQQNPRAEEPGLDVAWLDWYPGPRWTFTALALLGEGRLVTGRPFTRRFALKTDWTGNEKYASAIVSVEEETAAFTAGGYAGWTASEALLLHAEGSVRGEPVDGDLLLGGTWTFVNGVFVVVEYFHDGTGCDRDRIGDCFSPFAGGSSDVAEVLYRRNYLFAQVTRPGLDGRTHLTGRWVHGLDDGSDRLVGIVEREIGARTEAFAIGAADLGGAEDEFGSVVRAAVRLGVAVVF